MSLANHNAIWNSKKGAASGFGRIAAQADEALQPHLPKLVPKLFRYRFDPHKPVQDAMSNIWSQVVKDPIRATDKYFSDILDDILKNLGSTLWRAREASALALADLLRGRTWKEVGPRFGEVWKLAFRVIDDVKESVRAAGAQCCQRLIKLTTHLCQRERGNSAQEALNVALPIMIEEGIVSSANDVKSVALTVLVEVAKEAGAALKPHLATLLPTLLEALSGVESPQLDYLGQRLSTREGMEEKLDDLRMSASRGSPIAQCIDDCARMVDGETLKELMPRLLEIMKKGIGASTKAGCARLASTLSQNCREDLRPYTSKLLKAMLSAATIKSAPIRRDFANAIATVARSASLEDATGLIKKARKMYLNHEKPEAMETSAVVCKALARRANDVFEHHAAAMYDFCRRGGGGS